MILKKVNSLLETQTKRQSEKIDNLIFNAKNEKMEKDNHISNISQEINHLKILNHE